MTTFRGTLVRPRFLPPSRRCRPSSFLYLYLFLPSVPFNPFPIKVVHLPKMLREREKSPFLLASFSCFCRTEFRTKWRDLSVSSAMDGWINPMSSHAHAVICMYGHGDGNLRALLPSSLVFITYLARGQNGGGGRDPPYFWA